ncbi:MAG: hypothetical protein JXB05_08350 [Myxococcaceae bacterium]|nr:hypothetical protein [Myxococcaceae bacterium]
MPEFAIGVDSYTASTQDAVEHPDQLKAWWVRILPNQPFLTPGGVVYYSPYKVRVTERVNEGGRASLKFVLAREEAETSSPREFTLEWPFEQYIAWPDLPSTAQLADAKTKPYGFLLLSHAWEKKHGVDPKLYAELGGPMKWPPAAAPIFDAVDMPTGPEVERVLRAMKDDAVRAKLIETLDNMTRSKP